MGILSSGIRPRPIAISRADYKRIAAQGNREVFLHVILELIGIRLDDAKWVHAGMGWIVCLHQTSLSGCYGIRLAGNSDDVSPDLRLFDCSS